MSRTVLLAKEEPGGAAGFSWDQGGAEGAIEVDAQWADHLMSQTGSDFFIVAPKEKKTEKVAKTEDPEVKTKAKAEKKPEPATEDDLTQAIKLANGNTPQPKE